MFFSPLSGFLTAIGFSILIFVHELGHFLAAKLQGVRVDVFSLGFGPALRWKWRGTEYRLSVIPLGGFVKMAGEDATGGAAAAPDEFMAKTVGQRAIVFVAGSFMNLIFGFLFFILAYHLGVPAMTPRVGSVDPGSPAWEAGLQRGDLITRVNNLSKDVDFEDVRTTILTTRRGKSIRLTVERDGKPLDITLTPRYNRELGMMQAGIGQPGSMRVAAYDARTVRREAPEDGRDWNYKALLDAGMQPGDLITAVQLEGESAPTPLEDPSDFMARVRLSRGRPVRIAFTRNGAPQPPVSVTPERMGDDAWMVGIVVGPTRRVERVRAGSWAAAAGLKAEDVILSVNGRPVRSGREVEQTLDADPEQPATIVVQRGNAEHTLTAPSRAKRETVASAFAFANDNLRVAACDAGFPAAAAGLEPGDLLLAVNGKQCESFDDFHRAVQESKGAPISVEWLHGEERKQAEITPEPQWVIGVIWEKASIVRQAGVADSFRLGMRKSFRWVGRVYATLRGLIERDISPKQLSGPIAIVYVTYMMANAGIGLFFYFLGLVSVNLAVMNLLPIPIMDGGHLLFALLEKLRGRPVAEKVRSIANYAGLALILCIFVLAFWNDIRTFFLR